MDQNATVAVTSYDLQKAQEQAALLRTLLSDKEAKLAEQSAAGENTSGTLALISEIKADIDEIEDEAREYDYILNPRPRAELCRTCNDHSNVEVPTKPCASCGLTIVKGRPADGVAHWVLPGDDENIALPIGEEPQ